MPDMNYDVDAIAKNKQMYPDEYLIQAIHGQHKLPPIIAMMAGQKRKDLMTAGQGAEAKQKLGVGTVGAKVASELQQPQQYAGLAALPAENMQGMDEQHLAAGGIIAFKDEGLVPSPEGDIDPTTYENKSEKPGRKFDRELWESIKSIPGSVSNFFQEQNRPWSQIAAQTSPADVQAAMSGNIPKGTLPAPAAAQPNLPPTINSTPTKADLAAGVAPAGGVNFDPTAGGNPAVAALRNKQQAGVGTPPTQGGAATNAAQDQGLAALTKRPDRFAGLGDTQEAFDQKVADERQAARGDFLMNMGLKMMTTVGPLGKAIGEGGIAGLPGLTASRKTINDLEKNRKDYQLNMAKYQTAADQGDEETAYKYKALAEQAAYHSGLLAVERTKAGAYANSVGSKEDAANQRREASIMGIAKGLLEKNMKYNMPNTSPADRQAMEQAAINSAVNMYRSSEAAISGKSQPDLAGGISMDAIDAAIARKQKQS